MDKSWSEGSGVRWDRSGDIHVDLKDVQETKAGDDFFADIDSWLSCNPEWEARVRAAVLTMVTADVDRIGHFFDASAL